MDGLSALAVPDSAAAGDLPPAPATVFRQSVAASVPLRTGRDGPTWAGTQAEGGWRKPVPRVWMRGYLAALSVTRPMPNWLPTRTGRPPRKWISMNFELRTDLPPASVSVAMICFVFGSITSPVSGYA